MSDPLDDPAHYRLDEATIQRIFREDIVPDVLAGTPSDLPVLVVVGGQPGAGKSRAQDALLERLGRTDAVTIDADDVRPYHPRYAEAAARNDRTASQLTHPAAARWIDMAHEYVIGQRLSAVYSTTLRDPDGAAVTIDRYRQAGYRVEVAIVAVHEAQSGLGVLARYQHGHDQTGAGRYVPPAVHDAAYRGVLDTADRIDRDAVVDRVAVYDRSGAELYANEQADGQWQAPPATRESIEAARARRWSPGEAGNFVRQVTELREQLPNELRPVLETVARSGRQHLTTTTTASRPTDPAAAAFPASIRTALRNLPASPPSVRRPPRPPEAPNPQPEQDR